MQGLLTKVEGVEGAKVDFASKTATVECKKGTDKAALAKALTGKYGGSLQ